MVFGGGFFPISLINHCSCLSLSQMLELWYSWGLLQTCLIVRKSEQAVNNWVCLVSYGCRLLIKGLRKP